MTRNLAISPNQLSRVRLGGSPASKVSGFVLTEGPRRDQDWFDAQPCQAVLTLYRSNRAEFLAQLLAQQLLEQRPGPLETVEVLVNTWPTSRWLGEQLALANGISSLVRFPFPVVVFASWCVRCWRCPSTGGSLAGQSSGLVGAGSTASGVGSSFRGAIAAVAGAT